MEVEGRREQVELEQLKQEIDRWRRERQQMALGREMPAPLWTKAAAMARKVGVYRTSKVLRLNYAALKQRASARPRARHPMENRFIEVTASPPPFTSSTSNGGTVVEVVATDGARLVIRLAQTAVDLGVLVSAFRGRR